MRTGIIVQARTSSTRLPNKVLLPLPYGGSTTVLAQVIRRLKRVGGIDNIIIATTTDEEDLKIVEEAEREGVESFRGSKNNVLERYYLASKEFNLDQVIRVTSYCPCIDPGIITASLDAHIKANADYTSNTLKNKYPHGFDCEIFSFGALEKAYLHAIDDYDKEHVTPFIYKTHPELFNIKAVEAPDEIQGLNIRVTLDTQQDYTFLCTIYDYLFGNKPEFTFNDLNYLLKAKPWLREINGSVLQKKKYDTLKEELEDAVLLLKVQEMNKAMEILRAYSLNSNVY